MYDGYCCMCAESIRRHICTARTPPELYVRRNITNCSLVRDGVGVGAGSIILHVGGDSWTETHTATHSDTELLD